MANNRLYIEDTETGERLGVAKSFGKGWTWRVSAEETTEWLAIRDISAAYGNTGTEPSRLVFRTENEPEDEPEDDGIERVRRALSGNHDYRTPEERKKARLELAQRRVAEIMAEYLVAQMVDEMLHGTATSPEKASQPAPDAPEREDPSGA